MHIKPSVIIRQVVVAPCSRQNNADTEHDKFKKILLTLLFDLFYICIYTCSVFIFWRGRMSFEQFVKKNVGKKDLEVFSIKSPGRIVSLVDEAAMTLDVTRNELLNAIIEDALSNFSAIYEEYSNGQDVINEDISDEDISDFSTSFIFFFIANLCAQPNRFWVRVNCDTAIK